MMAMVTNDGNDFACIIMTIAVISYAIGGYKWILIDGDKIAALVSQLLVRDMTELIDSSKNSNSPDDHAGSLPFTIGVVQTAYANGASTRFLQSIGVQTTIAKTGVKYLHHKARKHLRNIPIVAFLKSLLFTSSTIMISNS